MLAHVKLDQRLWCLTHCPCSLVFAFMARTTAAAWTCTRRAATLVPQTAAVLQSFLEEFREEIGVKRHDKSVSYTALNKDSHVLEVPEELAKRVPSRYTACAGKKGVRRYMCDELQDLAASYTDTGKDVEAAQLSILSRITSSAFGQKRDMWLKVCSLD